MIIDKSILENELDWYKSTEGNYIFYRRDANWKIRMNDLPGDLLYTLFIEGKAAFDFDEWPDCWYKLD